MDCDAELSIYSGDERCAPCQRTFLDLYRTLPPIPAQVWADREIRDALAAWDFGTVARLVRQRSGLRQEKIAELTGLSQGFLSQLESGRSQLVNIHKIIGFLDGLGTPIDLRPIPREHAAASPDEVLDISPRLAELGPSSRPSRAVAELAFAVTAGPDLGGVEAIELLGRAEASDVGPATLTAIGNGLDRLCRSYTHTAPADLIVPLRAFQTYLAQLLGGRVTLGQRRELMRHAGWLSLLTATANLDLGHDRAAAANFEAAANLAAETGDLSLAAWVLETRAWQALSRGDHSTAGDLCRAGLDVAPRDSSAHVQLCTQMARVSARVGDGAATYRFVDEGVTAVGRMPRPDGPEHHFVCDEDRVVAFCAAALVWLCDDNDLGIAEDYARRAVAEYEAEADSGQQPHRLATARMNLALHLAQSGEPAEAAHLGTLAFDSSWRLCHTDLFLIDGLDRALTPRYRGQRDVTAFHDRYIDVRQDIHALGPGDQGSTVASPA